MSQVGFVFVMFPWCMSITISTLNWSNVGPLMGLHVILGNVNVQYVIK